MRNHAIWYGSMGFDVPYPGEDRVLSPNEVIPAEESEEDELEELAERGQVPDADADEIEEGAPST